MSKPPEFPKMSEEQVEQIRAAFEAIANAVEAHRIVMTAACNKIALALKDAGLS